MRERFQRKEEIAQKTDVPTGPHAHYLVRTGVGIFILLLVLASALGLQRLFPAYADGSTLMTWTGTSSSMSGATDGPDNQEQFVQDFIYSAIVQPDGTIWTVSGWDEAGHNYGEYRNGQVVGTNLGTNNHNLNDDSARSVQDRNGYTWTIEDITFVGGDKVCRADDTSICITGDNGFRPNALAIANDGSLMVADNGPDQQIKFYDVSSDAPSSTPIETFGTQGGVWAGPTPGLTGPLRFSGLWGTGMDSAGNIYVIGNFPGGGTWMRSLQPDGTMNWQRYGSIWVGNSAPDMSTDGQTAYSANAMFQLDYTQTTAGQETVGDFPSAVTVDWWNHPDDPRLTTSDVNNTYPVDTQASNDAHYAFGVVPKWIRDCYGHKFMFTTGMYSGQIDAYEQVGLMWVHVSFTNGPGNWQWANFADTNCDLWQSSPDGTVSQYPASGVDDAGNLVYGTAVNYPQINDFSEVTRLQYDRQNDVLYLSGFTDARPRQGGWGDVGTEFKAYSNWKSSPTVSVSIDLPYTFLKNADGSDDTGNSTYLKDWDIAGNYLFGAFTSINDQNSQRGSPAIWSLSDGSRVTNLTTSDPVPENSTGWVDVRGIATGLRANGEYVLFIEDDWRNKTLIYRWCPSGSCPETGSNTVN